MFSLLLRRTGSMLGELFPQRSGGFGLLSPTAAALSRLHLPRVAVVLRWPYATGQIRAVGKWYFAFYAASCLIWVTLGLFACVSLRVAVMNGVNNPTFGTTGNTGEDGLHELGIVVLGLASMMPLWVWLTGSLLLASALFATRRWWDLEERPRVHSRVRLTTLGHFTLFPFYMLLMTLLFVSSWLAVLCSIALSYPGLFERQVPEVRVSWECWFTLAAVLLVYRRATTDNRRLREYTAIPNRDGPHTILFGVVTLLAIFVKALFSREKRRQGAQQFDEAKHWTVRIREFEVWKLGILLELVSFYEREGLHQLLTPESPERKFYTPYQRDAFDRAYVAFRKEAASLGLHLQWGMDDDARLAAATALSEKSESVPVSAS